MTRALVRDDTRASSGEDDHLRHLDHDHDDQQQQLGRASLR
jgi:hypothetical protein